MERSRVRARHPRLALPLPELRTRAEEAEVFDPIRSQWVSLTPEEWVRQHVIHWLLERVGVPKGLLAVEKGIPRAGEVRRTDVVAYSRAGAAWMLVECKAPSVKIDQRTLDQVSRYAGELAAKHLVMTNGHALFIAARGDSGAYSFISDVPMFSD